MKRREFLALSGVAAASTLAASEKDDYIAQSGASEPEFSVSGDKVLLNPNKRIDMSMCHGCTTKCGLRVIVDKSKNRVLRCAGNPYHPLSNLNHIDYDTPLNDALLGTTNMQTRATACARGASLAQMIDSPARITCVLKRAGKRGEGKWKKISFKQLIDEVVEGGDLFGEGHVDGLRAICSDELIDEQNPEYGSKRNQLLSFYLYDGRSNIVDRFVKQAFGSVNHYSHGGICGGGFRVGGKIAHNAKGFMHTKPDYENQEFTIYWGTAPSNGSNPFQKQAKMLASARARDKFDYAVIDPSSSNAVVMGSKKGRFIHIRPGSDSALAMAMISWIIKNEKYATNYLVQPNLNQAKLAGEVHWCNATHLVITDKGHKDYGKFAKIDGKWLVCSNSGKIQSYEINEPARLFYSGKIELEGKKVMVKSSMQLLKEEAFKFKIDDYLKICGVSKDELEWLCKNLTSHGRKVGVNTHGGMMHTQAAASSYAVLCLNTLMGNYSFKGGMTTAQAPTHEFLRGRYELKSFEGEIKPKGLNLSRSSKRYEDSSEYKRKLEAGLNPYPATQPYYPISMPLINETLTSHFVGYPYKVKVWINYMTNVLYNQAGLKTAILERLKDSKDLPLIIGIDAFMTETNAYADYLVPDGVNLENWALPNAQWGAKGKTSVVRYPSVKSKQARDEDGVEICVEHFYISVAKRLGLKGFGKNAFKDSDGNFLNLDYKEQFYAAALANLAFDAGGVADISKDDERLSGASEAMSVIGAYLKPGERAKVANVLARGGRYEPAKNAYDGEFMKYKVPCPTPASIYYEPLGGYRHSITGEYMPGTPHLALPVAYDGTRLDLIFDTGEWDCVLSTKKSNLQHHYTIASPMLRGIKPENLVQINADTARKKGIKTGDKVRVITPYRTTVGTAFVTANLADSTISIEHGFGHRQYGAMSHLVDGVPSFGVAGAGAGVGYNELGLIDPKRNGRFSLNDYLVGTCARQALPAKVVKEG